MTSSNLDIIPIDWSGAPAGTWAGGKMMTPDQQAQTGAFQDAVKKAKAAYGSLTPERAAQLDREIAEYDKILSSYSGYDPAMGTNRQWYHAGAPEEVRKAGSARSIALSERYPYEGGMKSWVKPALASASILAPMFVPGITSAIGNALAPAEGAAAAGSSAGGLSSLASDAYDLFSNPISSVATKAKDLIGGLSGDAISGGAGADVLADTVAEKTLFDKVAGKLYDAATSPLGAMAIAGAVGNYQNSKDAKKAQQAQDKINTEYAAEEADKLAEIQAYLNKPLNRKLNQTSGVDFANYGGGGGFQFFDEVNPWDRPSYATGGSVETWTDPRDKNQQAARDLGYTGVFGTGGITDWRKQMGISDADFNAAGANYKGTPTGIVSKAAQAPVGSPVNIAPLPRALPSLPSIWYTPRDVNQRTARDVGYIGPFGEGGITDYRKKMGITDQEFNSAGAHYTGDSGIEDIPELNDVYKNFRSLRELGYEGELTPEAMADYISKNSIKDFELKNVGYNMAIGGAVAGAGGGQDDNVAANLSVGEFVVPADIVAHLGDGNNEEGAKRLEEFMEQVRSHKATKGHPPKAKEVGAYMMGGGNG